MVLSRMEGGRKHLGHFNTHLATCYARWAYDKASTKD